jgi:hypothetical protein
MSRVGRLMRTQRQTLTEERTPECQEPIGRFRSSIASGADWFDALLETIADWEAPLEVVAGRTYQYLIDGEAFDWLLLAERLCLDTDVAIPATERDDLLFFGRMPRTLDDDEFRHAIGDAKHKAHLNFVYGVAVEEALQLVIEEEVLKEQRSLVWNSGENVERIVFERIYGHSRDDLLDVYLTGRGMPVTGEMTYGDYKSFIYWLFKYRMNQSDPARVASDTRKALAQLSQLEGAARRRGARMVPEQNGAVVEGEVVARSR